MAGGRLPGRHIPGGAAFRTAAAPVFADGSPAPGGIGVNPFVTIAALAERTMARVLVEDSAP
ncbi:hypothetical protein ACWD3Z_13735 [Streptomyces sp. NPDC002740]